VIKYICKLSLRYKTVIEKLMTNVKIFSSYTIINRNVDDNIHLIKDKGTQKCIHLKLLMILELVKILYINI
jgi:hypothetical protein